MGKCDSTNLPGRLFCTQLHNHNEILHNHYQLSISVSKFSHIIWSFLLLSCHRYSCLVHLAKHNVNGPDDAYKNIYPLKIKKQSIFYHVSQVQQLYSTATLYLPGYIMRGAVLTIIKSLRNTHCVQTFPWRQLTTTNQIISGASHHLSRIRLTAVLQHIVQLA